MKLYLKKLLFAIMYTAFAAIIYPIISHYTKVFSISVFITVMIICVLALILRTQNKAKRSEYLENAHKPLSLKKLFGGGNEYITAVLACLTVALPFHIGLVLYSQRPLDLRILLVIIMMLLVLITFTCLYTITNLFTYLIWRGKARSKR